MTSQQAIEAVNDIDPIDFEGSIAEDYDDILIDFADAIDFDYND